MALTLRILQTLLGKIDNAFAVDFPLTGVSIDSRTLQKGELFIAIEGERVNGHQFLLDAHAKGAAAFIINRKLRRDPVYRQPFSDAFLSQINRIGNVVEVEDTLTALQVLGRQWAAQSQAKKVGVTGSCGKTTVKELLTTTLGASLRVTSSQGNLNNHLGVPLSLLRANLDVDVYVAEMGASKPGDIATLCEIVKPEIGVITNIAPAHLEGFGGLEGVYRTKTELVAYLGAVGHGVLVFDADDPQLEAFVRDYTVTPVTFGVQRKAQFKVTAYRENATRMIFSVNQQKEISVNKFSVLNVKNVLAAIAVADVLGIPFKSIIEVFEDCRPLEGRFSIKRTGKYVVINDSYNANPASFQQALSLVSAMEASGRKILVCGDMLELGEESDFWHRKVGMQAAAAGFDWVLGVGEGGRWIVEGFNAAGLKKPRSIAVAEKEDARDILIQELKEGDLVLFKASRGIRLEELIQAVQNAHQEQKIFP